uniref:L-type lectin-like domain-containing protein n=1 Tax=Elaeophora elaphi TaxID=1147741 RepID=A0A0R3S2B2_9BILA
SECQIYWDISSLRTILLLVVAVEKLFEFVIFRRLMKIFELEQCSNVHFCVTEIKKAFSTRNDTDDEASIFQVRKECQNGHTNYGIKPTPYSIDSVQVK